VKIAIADMTVEIMYINQRIRIKINEQNSLDSVLKNVSINPDHVYLFDETAHNVLPS
jgi:hypothetical protein